MTIGNAFAAIEKPVVHKPNPAVAVLFTGFGAGGNGRIVLDWLRDHNVSANRVATVIVFDNGTDDKATAAVPGDTFIYDPKHDSVHRVKAHMYADLYDEAGS